MCSGQYRMGQYFISVLWKFAQSRQFAFIAALSDFPSMAFW